MSNKIVPTVYRAVIDDVIINMKSDFEEFGVSEDVLAELQSKWEDKVMASHVAEFDVSQPQPAQHHAYPPHPMHMIPAHYAPPPHNPYVQAPPQPVQNGQGSSVKSEPVDSRYILSGPQAIPGYTLPPLPGPSLNGARAPPPHPGGHQGILTFSPNGPQAQRLPPAQTAPAATAKSYPPSSSAPRIPQTDGPSDSSDESDAPSGQSYAPHSSHPSLPQPSASTSQPVDSEAINSDLDDSDTEGEDDQEEGGGAESDIVFCTYDKVARVKNKWKCILKDGMIHVNGKDYLFAKCTGEFEW